jgi:hypothetical protein
MVVMDATIAGGVLTFVVVAGLVAHEWAHALVLRLAAIDYTISYAPNRRPGVFGLIRSCPWAVVHPHPTGAEPPWVLRVAALAPLALAVPILAVLATGASTPGSMVTTVALIGWLACTIPSPQDFSVAFYAHTALRNPVLTEQHASGYGPRAD